MAKKKLLLSIEEDKIRELKKKAIDADLTLSEFLSRAGTITPYQQVKDSSDNSGAASTNDN